MLAFYGVTTPHLLMPGQKDWSVETRICVPRCAVNALWAFMHYLIVRGVAHLVLTDNSLLKFPRGDQCTCAMGKARRDRCSVFKKKRHRERGAILRACGAQCLAAQYLYALARAGGEVAVEAQSETRVVLAELSEPLRSHSQQARPL